MAPIYADHPFPLITSPKYLAKQKDAGYRSDVVVDVASGMAMIHNAMIRGLNSIYLQAKHIQPMEQVAFCHYALTWSTVLESHHHGEEEHFFPYIATETGGSHVMDVNVEQHHAFLPAANAFRKYLQDVLAKKQAYDGTRIVGMIDSFAGVLTQHLTDEIDTLLALQEYGVDKFKGLQQEFDAEGAREALALGVTTGSVWLLLHLPLDYEDGLWRTFPPAPAPVKFALRNVVYWLHSDWWKFAPCDYAAKWRPLYAVGE